MLGWRCDCRGQFFLTGLWNGGELWCCRNQPHGKERSYAPQSWEWCRIIMLSSRRGSMQYSSRCRLRRAGHDYLFDVCFQTSGRDWSAEGMLHTSVIQHHFTYSNCPCQGTASSPVQVKPVVFLVAELMRLTVRHLDQPTPSKKNNWLQNPLRAFVLSIQNQALHWGDAPIKVNLSEFWKWLLVILGRTLGSGHVLPVQLRRSACDTAFSTREAKRHAQGVAELSYARHQDV